MKNDVVTKVNKIGKAGVIITNIGKVILWIGLVACLVAGVILKLMPDDLVVMHMKGVAAIEVNMPAAFATDGSYVVKDGDIALMGGNVNSSLEVNGQEYGLVGLTQTENGFVMEAETGSYTLKFGNIASVVFLGGVACAAILIMMHFVGKLCILFRDCETPFTEEIVQALKKLAISIIPMAFFSNLAESVSNSIMSGNVKIVIGVDLTTVLLVLLVFMLSAIFSYGTMLQQESDETL